MKPNSTWKKYIFLPFEMATIIALFVLGGRYLDKVVQNTFPWFLMLALIVGVLVSLVYVFRNLRDKK